MVFFVSDPDQLPRQVVDIIPMKYVIRIGNELVEVHECELEDEADEMTKIRNAGRKED